jgi:hypothetical protein
VGVEPSAYVVAAAAEDVVVVLAPVEPDEVLNPDTRLLLPAVKLPWLFFK